MSPAGRARSCPPARVCPIDTGASRHPKTIGELRLMILNVANVDDLVLHLGNLVPTEAALRIVQVERVNGIVDHRPADAQVAQHLRLCIRSPGLQWSVHALDSPLVVLPRTKGPVIRLEIQMCVVERVICNSPEWVGMTVAAGPQIVRTAPNGCPQHRKGGVVLAL